MTTAVVKREESHELPTSLLTAIERRNMIVEAMRLDVMVKDKDFGTIPGTDKPTLLKPGAEKLCTLFGLSVEKPEIIEKEQDWTGKDHGGEPFFYYLFCQRLTRNGETVAAQMGSCNSWEKKYRYRWVPQHELPPGLDTSGLQKKGGKISEFAFAVDKAETGGKYGKPAAYWQAFKDAIADGTARSIRKKKRDGGESEGWEIDGTLYRLPNPDVADSVNAILKMAQKRALIASTLVATNASEFFTQDVEDMEIIEAEFEVKSVPMPELAPPRNGGHTNGNGNGHKPPKATPPQLQSIADLARRCGVRDKAELTEYLQQHHNIAPGSKLSEHQAQAVILDLQEIARELETKQAQAAPRDREPGEDDDPGEDDLPAA